MIYALVAALLALFGALFYAYRQGRKAAEAQAEVVKLRQWNIVQMKAIHALGKAVENEQDIRDLADKIQRAHDIDELNRLYAEITGSPDPGSDSG